MGEVSTSARRSPRSSRGDGSAKRLAQDEYRILLEGSPVPMWHSETASGRDYVNPAWLAFTGRTAAQELGEGWAEGVHPEDRERCLRAGRSAFALREAFEIEYRLRRHDGVYRQVLDRGQPYDRGAKFHGFFGTCLDVQERQEAERARERFLRTMVHELRTPLQAVKVFVELMRRNAIAGRPSSPEMLERLTVQIDRFARLVEDLSEASRVRDVRIASDRLDLSELLRKLVERRREAIRADPAGAAHEIRYRDGARAAPIRGDRERLGQAFTSLLDNALKYSPRGGSIEVALEERDGRYLVSVRDPGIGIPREEIRLVTGRFYRASNVTASGFPGAGLGLSLAREIVDRHDGRLEIESGSGEGTRVTVILPGSGD